MYERMTTNDNSLKPKKKQDLNPGVFLMAMGNGSDSVLVK